MEEKQLPEKKGKIEKELVYWKLICAPTCVYFCGYS